MGVNRPQDLPWKPYNKSSKYLVKCYNVYLLLLNFILNIPHFEYMKFLSSGYSWPSFLRLFFLGQCFCITQFHTKVHPYQLLHWLLLKPPHPSLPLKGQSHALRLEYLVKNTFTTATVKSTLKNVHNCMYYLYFTCFEERHVLWLPYISRRKLKSGGKSIPM